MIAFRDPRLPGKDSLNLTARYLFDSRTGKSWPFGQSPVQPVDQIKTNLFPDLVGKVLG